MALNATLVKSTVVAALGGLLFGFDTAVIAGTTGALSRFYDLTPGGLRADGRDRALGHGGGRSARRYSRATAMGGATACACMANLYLISALGCAFAWNWYALVFSRFIGGLAIGGSSVLGPMYIAEIAPAKWRGRLVGFFQFNVVSGILAGLFLQLRNRADGTSAPPSGDGSWAFRLCRRRSFFLMLFLIPRSPRWLVQKGRTAEARAVLELIGEENMDAELRRHDSPRCELEHQHGQERLFSAQEPASRCFWRFRSRCSTSSPGINAILYYLNDIFARGGIQQGFGGLAGRGHRRPPTCCSPCWRCR